VTKTNIKKLGLYLTRIWALRIIYAHTYWQQPSLRIHAVNSEIIKYCGESIKTVFISHKSTNLPCVHIDTHSWVHWSCLVLAIQLVHVLTQPSTRPVSELRIHGNVIMLWSCSSGPSLSLTSVACTAFTTHRLYTINACPTHWLFTHPHERVRVQCLWDISLKQKSLVKSAEYYTAWAPAGFFSCRGGQWKGLKDGSPPAGSRGSSPVASGGEAPKSWRHFLKMMYKFFVYTQDLDNICSNKTTFQHFQGRASAPCPCLRVRMQYGLQGKLEAA